MPWLVTLNSDENEKLTKTVLAESEFEAVYTVLENMSREEKAKYVRSYEYFCANCSREEDAMDYACRMGYNTDVNNNIIMLEECRPVVTSTVK